MSDGQTSRQAEAPRRTAARRRARYGLVTLLLLTTVTVAAGLANVLADRFRARFDVTASGDQKLAPRTERLLKGLRGDYRVVIAADQRAIDARARERVQEVLAEMTRTADTLDATIIDTGSPAGLGEFQRLVGELAERDRAAIERQAEGIGASAAAATALAEYLSDTLSPLLLSIRDELGTESEIDRTNRTFFEQTAANMRIVGAELSAAADEARGLLTAQDPALPVPSLDRAAERLEPAMAQAVDQLTALSRELGRFAEARAAVGPAADRVRPHLLEIGRRRDAVSVALDTLRRQQRLDVLRVVEALRAGAAALVIGPPDVGLAAIDLESLFPSTEWLNAVGVARADMRQRTEELIVTSIASLTNPDKPIVVLMHGEVRPFIKDTPLFKQLERRLSLRGIDMVEWAPVAEPNAPALTTLNPDGSRPVVYAVLSPDSSTSAPRAGDLSGAQRAARLGEAITSVASSGRSLLVSLNPSVLPTYGERDPITAPLQRWGLYAETGRPLLREQVTQRGRVIEEDRTIVPTPKGHPIADAVVGLPVRLPWPIPIFEKALEDGTRLKSTTVLELPRAEDTWGESQWLRLWQTPRDQRTLLPDPPSFDPARDQRAPEGEKGVLEAWPVAVAAERFEVGLPVQRLVVVGSNAWFSDPVTQSQIDAGGRMVAAYPGNLEFFEAAVSWLAGQESLIAQSAIARPVPLVRPLDPETLRNLRLGVIAGLPLCVLLLGLLYRLIRG